MKWALKVFKKDTSLAKKQEQKYQRLMTAISLELVIIVVKSIILKNHITKDEKDIFVAENVIQNIGQNYYLKKNKTLMEQVIHKKKGIKERRRGSSVVAKR